MGTRDQRVRNHNKIEECGVKFSRIVLNNIVAAAILNNESWSRESWIWSHSSELTQGNVKLGVEFQYFIIPRTKVYRAVQNSALIFRRCSCVELIYVNVLFFLQKSQPGLSHFTLPTISGVLSVQQPINQFPHLSNYIDNYLNNLCTSQLCLNQTRFASLQTLSSVAFIHW